MTTATVKKKNFYTVGDDHKRSIKKLTTINLDEQSNKLLIVPDNNSK